MVWRAVLRGWNRSNFNLLLVNWKTLKSDALYEKQLVHQFYCQSLIPVVFVPSCGKTIFDQIFFNPNSIVIDASIAMILCSRVLVYLITYLYYLILTWVLPNVSKIKCTEFWASLNAIASVWKTIWAMDHLIFFVIATVVGCSASGIIGYLRQSQNSHQDGVSTDLV